MKSVAVHGKDTMIYTGIRGMGKPRECFVYRHTSPQSDLLFASLRLLKTAGYYMIMFRYVCETHAVY